MVVLVYCEFIGGIDMLSGLNYLILVVSQLVLSVVFYQQLLGMMLYVCWDSGVYFFCGDLWLCLLLDLQWCVILLEESDYIYYVFSISEVDFVSFVVCFEVVGVVVWKLNCSEGVLYYFFDFDGYKLELYVGSFVQWLVVCCEQLYKGMVFFEQ